VLLSLVLVRIRVLLCEAAGEDDDKLRLLAEQARGRRINAWRGNGRDWQHSRGLGDGMVRAAPVYVVALIY
jgi:hypothetical protein